MSPHGSKAESREEEEEEERAGGTQ